MFLFVIAIMFRNKLSNINLWRSWFKMVRS